jgi:4-hydroxythreonine-4-phosphate dehydrogenase
VVRSALRSLREEAPEVETVVFGDPVSFESGLPPGVRTVEVEPFDGSVASAGRVSLASLEGAVETVAGGEADALVTGPVHKPALHAAGARVPGQTELLRTLTGAERVGMLMHAASTRLGPHPLRILLATTHLPLREVPDRLTRALLEEQVRLLDASLREGWRLESPAIGVCGLNPHASDGGLFGDEEAAVIEPAIRALRADGLRVDGPHPADTVFLQAVEGGLDAVVAPYHDVGMAVFKTLSFGRGVNTTLGLPFPRTSPDHGTAFDLVGTGRADPASSLEALRLATTLARARSASASSRTL